MIIGRLATGLLEMAPSCYGCRIFSRPWFSVTPLRAKKIRPANDVTPKRSGMILGGHVPFVSFSTQTNKTKTCIGIAIIFALGCGTGYVAHQPDGLGETRIVTSAPAPAPTPAMTVAENAPENIQPAIPFTPPADEEAAIHLPVTSEVVEKAVGITGNPVVDDVFLAATQNKVPNAHIEVTDSAAHADVATIADEEVPDVSRAMVDGHKTAIKELRAHVKREPDDIAARHELADELAKTDSFDALSELQKMARAEPDDAALQAAMAQFLARHQDDATAISHIIKAIRLDAANLAYRFNLAVLYDRTGKGAQALMLYQQILQASSYADDTTLRTLPMDSIRARVRYLAAEIQ